MDRELTPSDLVAKQVRELRSARGMTVKQLSARCAELGVRLSEQALYKLEAQRDVADRPARPVTVDELLALAYALDVAPVYLITGMGGEDEELPVLPLRSFATGRARKWIRGLSPLPGVNNHRFEINRPEDEANSRWFVVRDATSYEQLERALEAIQGLVSLARWRDENEGGET